ncbi:MAG TPA: DoxX family protein [Gaiellaceae bacterium]|nr:DoxX family protein [Gaiellaceae bacterium]
MAYGLLFLRVVVGLIFFAHGAQKLLGWFDGPGLAGVRGWLGSMGMRMPALMALLVACSETSGLLLALGLLTPFVALALVTTMFVAIATVHWKNGFFSGKGGYEFNLSLVAAAVAIAATGPGRFSLDRAFGWDDNLSGLWWGVGVLVVAALTAAFIVTALRTPPAPAPAE